MHDQILRGSGSVSERPRQARANASCPALDAIQERLRIGRFNVEQERFPRSHVLWDEGR